MKDNITRSDEITNCAIFWNSKFLKFVTFVKTFHFVEFKIFIDFNNIVIYSQILSKKDNKMNYILDRIDKAHHSSIYFEYNLLLLNKYNQLPMDYFYLQYIEV